VQQERPTRSASSRTGWLPSPAVSYAVAATELRRTWRKLRGQDVWLAVAGVGAVLVLVSMPIAFGFGREFGREFLAGERSLSTATLALIVVWLAIAVFGVFSGLGSEGELDNQAAVLTARPPKDVAGGLMLTIVLGYAPFLLLPGLAGGAGFAAALGTPAPLVGFTLAAVLVLATATATGYVLGLWCKGIVRRTPWLERHKPALGLSLFAAYIWLSASGRLWPLLRGAGDALSASPMGWLGNLAFVTTPDAGLSTDLALAAVTLGTAVVAVTVYGVVRAAEYAWYVEGVALGGTDPDEPTERTAGKRIDSALETVGIGPATRGVTTAVLVRAYRSPLQLVYVAIPLLFALPAFESMLRTASAPLWAPWAVLVYGGWAAGTAFPLNLLGNQGATLPALLTTNSRGRPLVHGHVLAGVIAFVPATLVAAVGTGLLAGLSGGTLLQVVAATPVAVVAGSVLAAALGAAFPRFKMLDITSARKARLPSKLAFVLFSIASVLLATAAGVTQDVRYRFRLSQSLSLYLPMEVSRDSLLPYARGLLLLLVVLVPLAYLFAVRRVDGYHMD
jgi:ABC-2 type transport system permease protein